MTGRVMCFAWGLFLGSGSFRRESFGRRRGFELGGIARAGWAVCKTPHSMTIRREVRTACGMRFGGAEYGMFGVPTRLRLLDSARRLRGGGSLVWDRL